MRTLWTTLARVACAALLTAPLSAQLGSYNPEPGPRGTFAIRGGTIVPVTGADIPGGTVVIQDGKITAVGANVTVPAGATVIDATGLRVYPGMIESKTTMGLFEIESGAASMNDYQEVGRFMPNIQAIFGINPHSAHIGVSRVVGITSVVSTPAGGVISGQAALINLAGFTAPGMAVRPRIAMAINLPGGGAGGRGGAGAGVLFPGAAPGRGGGGAGGGATAGPSPLDSLKQLFQDATLYAAAHEAYKKSPDALPRPAEDVVLAAMVPLARGEQRAIFQADAAADIRNVLAFASEMKIKPVIIGGREALQVAEQLKAAEVPVVYTHTMNLPQRADDPYDINYGMPGKLVAAGVRLVLSSGEPNPDIRNLPYTAGMAAAHGLSKADALKAVTLWPAQAWGVADIMGSIEVGKMANLVVTTGDMLEATTDTRYLFIDGRQVPLGTKHTDLNDIFKNRKGSN